MNKAKVFFSPPLPHVIAHRGFHELAQENTLAAFAAAIEAGATHLETDVQATADGVAVLHHDDAFHFRGEQIRIHTVTLEQLRRMKTALGLSAPTLVEALRAFPRSFFNIDVKSANASGPTVRDIIAADASSRVLIASFSSRRRRTVTHALSGVATSASRGAVIGSWIASRLRIQRLVALCLRDVDAVQVPTHIGPIPVVTARFVRACHLAGKFVHVWTINDSSEMQRLLSLGVDGIVTDRADLASTALGQMLPE